MPSMSTVGPVSFRLDARDEGQTCIVLPDVYPTGSVAVRADGHASRRSRDTGTRVDRDAVLGVGERLMVWSGHGAAAIVSRTLVHPAYERPGSTAAPAADERRYSTD